MATNGGEKLEARVGQHSLGLSTRDLLPVLILAAGVVGGYVIHTQTSKALVLIYNQHLALEEQLIHHAKEFTRILAVMEWNCQHDAEQRLPMALDPELLKRKVPQSPPLP